MAHIAINAGELNQRVKLRTRTPGKDSTGAPIVSNADSQTYAANIATTSGREFENAGVTVGEATHVVTMRAFTATKAMTNKDSIVFGTRVFEILTIQNVGEENVVLAFVCKEER